MLNATVMTFDTAESRNQFIENGVSKDGFEPMLYNGEPFGTILKPKHTFKDALEMAIRHFIQKSHKRAHFMFNEIPVYLYDDVVLPMEVGRKSTQRNKQAGNIEKLEKEAIKDEAAIIAARNELEILDKELLYLRKLLTFPTIIADRKIASILVLKTDHVAKLIA